MYLRIMLYLGLLSARTGEREILEFENICIFFKILFNKFFF